MTGLAENSYEKSARLPTFDETDDQFQIFWMRFKAYAKVDKQQQEQQVEVLQEQPQDEDITDSLVYNTDYTNLQQY
jgi:hypothetical protein